LPSAQVLTVLVSAMPCNPITGVTILKSDIFVSSL